MISISDADKIKKQVKQEIDKFRYQHTLGVAYTASCLAMCYGISPERAYLAGILHDCAKGIPDGDRLDLCKKYGLSVSEVEKKNPALLHAKLGAYLAEHKYHVEDREILSAVEFHTTGRPDMTLLEKIVFTADYIELRRNTAPRLPEIRKAAFSNLDEAVYMILSDTIHYLNSKNRSIIDETTAQTFAFYSEATGHGSDIQ